MSFMKRITNFFSKENRTPDGIDLSKPSLEGLAYLLRHPGEWPKDFWWNYSNCSHCALGLAMTVWPQLGKLNSHPIGLNDQTYTKYYTSLAARGFGIPYEDASRIFMYAYNSKTLPTGINSQRTTPEHVAMVIDAYRKMKNDALAPA